MINRRYHPDPARFPARRLRLPITTSLRGRPFSPRLTALNHINVQVQGSGAALSRGVPCNAGFGVWLSGKLDDLERFTPLLGVPQVILHLLAQPALGAGVKGNG